MSVDERTDEQLLAAFVRGESGALGLLAGRHERALLGLALGLLGGRREQAMDAVQETWVRVIRHAGSFRGNSTVKTWLYRIAINRCRDLAHDRALKMTSLNHHEVEPKPDLRTAAHAAPHALDNGLLTADRLAKLRAAVARLGPNRSVVVMLCYHAGMTHEQAAGVLDIPVGTLKSRLSAALAELRGLLGTEGTPDLKAKGAAS